ncbi:hypothetical protein N9276_01495 [Rhodopirellula sp.]|mgnify:CR=1 FL=1|nr:hypothetical protein [bacterium]MDB4423234.1 hypothetical protein [Rhodopirellula sp.]
MSICESYESPRVSRLAMLIALLFVVVIGRPAYGYTPTGPVVTKMVNQGVAYLEKLTDKDFGGGDPFSAIAGEAILIGYAHHKCRHDRESAAVKRALKNAKAVVSSLTKGGGKNPQKRTYVIAICVLLFAEVDADAYRSELQTLQQYLVQYQSGNGAFCYPDDDPNKSGDISMSQYGMLAIWTLDRNGIPLDYNRVTESLQWLLRVQDPGGGWPYHARDPGAGKGRVAQSTREMTDSMALAGGSSLLIGGDALRLWGNTDDDADTGIPGLPKAIKIYKEDKNIKRRKRGSMSETPIKQSIQVMRGWRQKNPYKKSGIDWYYYRIYTLERFESFVEIASGSAKDLSPAWYNRVVDELKQTQGADGGWTDRSQTRPPVSTAFSLLFLIRSTQKTIFTMSQGSLQGGKGLPKDTTDIRVDGTQIKGRAVAAQVTDMLDILEKDGAGSTEGKSIPDDLELDTDPVVRGVQMDRLQRLVRGSKSWQARRVAARLLGKSDELRVVPSLIFALSDPDGSVRRYARDGLRFISRRFDGFDLSNDPNPAEVDKVQGQWRDWYRTMNPKYVFLDYDL